MNCKNFYNDIQKYPADDQSSKSPWRLFQPHPIQPHKRKKCRLKLTNVTRNDAGLYRCVSSERVLKSFELEVQGEWVFFLPIYIVCWLIRQSETINHVDFDICVLSFYLQEVCMWLVGFVMCAGLFTKIALIIHFAFR